MPPRNASGRGSPLAGARGLTPPAPRGGRRGGASRGSQPGLTPSLSAREFESTVAVHLKRPNYGTAGRAFEVIANSLEVVTSDSMTDIFHYDVVVDPGNLPPRVNLELFTNLQASELTIFTPKIVYDGRKNAFSPRELPLGETKSRKFSVSVTPPAGGNNANRPPRVYHITLTRVAKINTEILQRFSNGKQEHDERVLTAIMGLNVVIRMDPNLKYTFNKRSFYMPEGKRDIGHGVELWRGIFQSIRPAIGRLIVNIDLTTGVMYKGGRLIDVCLDFLGQANANPTLLAPANGLPEYKRLQLQKFLAGLRVEVVTTGNKQRVIRGLSRVGANAHMFSTHAGVQMAVSQYFTTLGHPLVHPAVLCVQIGSSAMVPLELCRVPEGQIMRKTLDDAQARDRLEFSSMSPVDRLKRVKAGISALEYGQSQYVRQFGMNIDSEPLSTPARQIDPPTLKYGKGSKQPTIKPRDGAWNMIDKKFFEPAVISRWALAIYASQRNVNDRAREEVINSFKAACEAVGVKFLDPDPVFQYLNGQGNISAQLKALGRMCKGGPPALIVAILPETGADIYRQIKHFGDIEMGVPTQCLQVMKCTRAKPQYWANLLLKVNVKLGGINVIPDSSTLAASLTDPNNATIVMGADVIHPSPGSVDRPSFTALVGSVDSNAAKYVSTTSVQTGRQELIDDLKNMSKHILGLYMLYREQKEKVPVAKVAPKRLIFFRDGVSEGQFQQVLDVELPRIKAACEELGINPKVTLVIVGKRHHNQIFPKAGANVDSKTGNCPAGTVIDRVIVHPTDFDFILLSHAAIGKNQTTRPGHYSVIHDENSFNADSFQALSYALCHVYARCTRSVSIPAPVYYADIVCSRAKNHFDPSGNINFSETGTQASGGQATTNYLETYQQAFKPLHQTQQTLMYFS